MVSLEEEDDELELDELSLLLLPFMLILQDELPPELPLSSTLSISQELPWGIAAIVIVLVLLLVELPPQPEPFDPFEVDVVTVYTTSLPLAPLLAV
ncbi:MAG TPA: hypothetical protein VMU97_01825 [Candidatus Dormibacteraeota bacterium]|nr:hypothetical protein [Candidatus Dormibacteraeota bacterium]